MLSLQDSFILIFSILIIIFIISYFFTKLNKLDNDNIEQDLLKNYMGFLLIIFGFLKLYDLKKFTEIFSKYDLISKNIKIYAFLYPFIEIFLGLLMLKNIKLRVVNFITLFLVIISIISVSLSLKNGIQLRCGCIGTLFHIPLSYITISENILMLIILFKKLLSN